MNGWANAIGILACGFTGIGVVAFQETRVWGFFVGVSVTALYILGWYVGQADLRRYWWSRSNWEKGMIITLGSGEKLRVVEVVPPSCEEKP